MKITGKDDPPPFYRSNICESLIGNLLLLLLLLLHRKIRLQSLKGFPLSPSFSHCLSVNCNGLWEKLNSSRLFPYCLHRKDNSMNLWKGKGNRVNEKFAKRMKKNTRYRVIRCLRQRFV